MAVTNPNWAAVAKPNTVYSAVAQMPGLAYNWAQAGLRSWYSVPVAESWQSGINAGIWSKVA